MLWNVIEKENQEIGIKIGKIGITIEKMGITIGKIGITVWKLGSNSRNRDRKMRDFFTQKNWRNWVFYRKTGMTRQSDNLICLVKIGITRFFMGITQIFFRKRLGKSKNFYHHNWTYWVSRWRPWHFKCDSVTIKHSYWYVM